MRATKGYVAGVGTTSALLGAIGCAFAILSAVVAVHGWPLTIGAPGVATLDGGGAAAGPEAAFPWPAGPLFGGTRAGAPAGALPRLGDGAPRAGGGEGVGAFDPTAGGVPGDSRPGPVRGTAGGGGTGDAAPAEPARSGAPSGGSGDGPGGGGSGGSTDPTPSDPGVTTTVGGTVTQVTGSAGGTLTQAGQQLGGAVQDATGQLGGAVGEVSPAAGQTVTQTGEAAGGAVSGTVGTVGDAVSGAGAAVGGALGALGAPASGG